MKCPKKHVKKDFVSQIFCNVMTFAFFLEIHQKFWAKMDGFYLRSLAVKKQVTSFPLNPLFSESDGKRGILEELSRGQIITGKEPKMNMLDFWVFQKYSNAVTFQNPLSHAFRGIT